MTAWMSALLLNVSTGPEPRPDQLEIPAGIQHGPALVGSSRWFPAVFYCNRRIWVNTKQVPLELIQGIDLFEFTPRKYRLWNGPSGNPCVVFLSNAQCGVTGRFGLVAAGGAGASCSVSAGCLAAGCFFGILRQSAVLLCFLPPHRNLADDFILELLCR
jgi:hypothetical protein